MKDLSENSLVRLGLFTLTSGPGRIYAATSVMCDLAIIAAALTAPYLLRLIVDGDGPVVGLVLSLVGAWYIGTILMSLKSWLSTKATNLIYDRISRDVLKNYILYSDRQQAQTPSPAISSILVRLNYSIEAVFDGLITTVLPLFVQALAVIVLVHLSFGAKYSLLALLTVCLFFAVSSIAANRSDELSGTANEATDELSKVAADVLSNRRNIRANDSWKFEMGMFQHAAAHRSQQTDAVRRQLFVLAGLAFGSIALLMGFTLGLAAMEIETEVLTVGELVMLQSYLISFAIPVTSFGFALRHARMSMSNVEEAFSIIDRIPDLIGGSSINFAKISKANLRVKSLSYQAPDGFALKALTHTFPAGSKTAVVGANGSGKSTFLRLLARLDGPYEGTVEIGGYDLTDSETSALRRTLTYVSQDAVLFNRTIRDNICYPQQQADTEKVLELLRAFDPDGSTLIDQLDRVAADSGQSLSGGERQKILLARALLRDCRVLLLDESTSAMDANSEEAALRAIWRFKPDATMIFVTHRLKSAAMADLIVVMDAGRIVEKGDHASLLASSGYYSRLWTSQSTNQPT